MKAKHKLLITVGVCASLVTAVSAGLDHSAAQECDQINGPTQSCSYTIQPGALGIGIGGGTYTWTASTEPCEQKTLRLKSGGSGEWVTDTGKCGEATYSPPALCPLVPTKLACGSTAAKVKASNPE